MRLPIPDEQLAYLELPAWGGAGPDTRSRPAVTLRARFAGSEYSWEGEIVRTEGEIDPRSRMVHVVARVDAMADSEDTDRPPLSVGLFVRAEIQGKQLDSAVVIPRRALQNESQVFVIDASDRLVIREVKVLRIQGDSVVLGSGVEPGERLCLSPIRIPVPGMKVDPVPIPATSAT